MERIVTVLLGNRKFYTLRAGDKVLSALSLELPQKLSKIASGSCFLLVILSPDKFIVEPV